MFWNKKDQKSLLPDLPPATPLPAFASSLFPETSEDDSSEDEKHALPSFPDSPIQKGFAQSAIKDAVTPPETDDSASGRNFKTIEMEDTSSETQIQAPPLTVPPMSMPMPKKMMAKMNEGKTEDIFIRIDKFRSAKRAIRDAQLKLEEIESVIKKIRETKLREEQELELWEKEMVALKSRIKNVTENVFEKTE